MRDLVHWLHALDGNLLVHGAAVATEGAGLLLVGPGGRGKSTAATTLLRRGFAFAGEDYVAIDPSTRRAFGVYTSVKLLPGDVERHASVRAERIEPAHDRDDKVALLLDETPPGFVEGIELVAVAAPHVTPEATDSQDPGWARVAPAAMVAALAPSTLFQTVGFRHTTFAACAHVVKSLPTYTWTPGPLDGAYDERLELHARAILRDALEAA